MDIQTNNYIITYTVGDDVCYIKRRVLSKIEGDSKRYITEYSTHELSDYEKEWIMNPFVGNPGVIVTEVDGSPSELCQTLKFPNASISIASGVATITIITSETDPIVGAITGLVKANGAGTIAAAVAGTDYVASETDPIVGAITGLVKANGAGVIAAAVANTDYQVPPSEGAFADGDKTKLNGIETAADVTDSTNVNAILVSPGPIGTTAPGLVRGQIDTIIQAATDTLTAAEVSGSIISNYGQAAENTQTLPAAAQGLNGIVVIATAGAGAFHLKAGASDKIYLNGTALDDGDKVSLATPAVGDYFTFWAFKTAAAAYDWIVSFGQGTLTDGGA